LTLTDVCTTIFFPITSYKVQDFAAAKSANRILGMISRTFVNKDSKTMLKLYQLLVRPKLEYCVQAYL